MKTIPYPEKESTVKWVSTEWLEKHHREVTVLDTQPDIHDYITEHVPGAVYFNQRLLRVPHKGRPGVYVPDGVIQQLFSRVGLMPDTPVVVYGGTGAFRGWGDGLEQTMVAFTLARYGHRSVHVLNGGIDTWKTEQRTLVKEFPDITESDFPIEVQHDYVVDMDRVKDMKDDDNVMLLDARPPKFYEGQGPWRKPGHIPGAINLPWKTLMQEGNAMLLKPDEGIQAVLNDRGISEDKTIICSCGTGREATNEFLLFKWYLGYPEVHLYEGSFTEWTSHPDNPTVTGPEPS